MKNQQAIVNALSGINELQPQQPSQLSELVNWHTDDLSGGWSNKLGYEKYFAWKTDWEPFTSLKKVDSLFYFHRHQGAQDSIIFEAGGKLYHLFEHGSAAIKTLVDDRTIPRSVEPSTQYLPIGKFLTVVNGYDRPIKYLGWPILRITGTFNPAIYPLGFHRVPGTPVAWGVEPNPTVATTTNTNSISVQFKAVPELGLGIDEDTKKNSYRWKVSFINNAGAESPLSSASEQVNWTTNASEFRYACAIEIPVGENDVVARRLYRTKNFSTDGGNDGSLYYYVTDIPNNNETLYIDSTPDLGLGTLAPGPTESIVFPSFNCRFTGLYKDCLFIDGGKSNDTVIYYSNPSRPDQFSALDFISVGNRQGGGITGFFGYFGYMLVFRENSIDVIQGDYPNFVATPFQEHIGTKAVDTITSVPGLGVVFLTTDGVYAVGANLEYSDTTSVVKISHELQDTISTMNVATIAQATACYSEKHREWHCYFAVDGSPINNTGIVYHTDKKVWSIRKEFPVNNMVKNSDADLIFGLNASAATADDPAGLFVVSRKRATGEKIDGEEMVNKPPPSSKIASAWLDMGDPALKKKVHAVFLYIRTGGSQKIELTYLKDFDYNLQKNSTKGILQRPDFTNQKIYDLVSLDKGDFWEEPVLTPIRFDVHNASCSWFQWFVETTEDVVVVGYAIDFTASNMRIIAGKKL